MGNGFAPHGNPPTEWSEAKNVRWKTALPGLGHSSPIVWGDHVYLTTAVPYGNKLVVPEQPSGAHNNLDPLRKMRFQVLALDRKSGKILWRATALNKQPHQSTHESGTWASNSPVTDGRHVIASFGSSGLYCLNTKSGKPSILLGESRRTSYCSGLSQGKKSCSCRGMDVDIDFLLPLSTTERISMR